MPHGAPLVRIPQNLARVGSGVKELGIRDEAGPYRLDAVPLRMAIMQRVGK